MGDPSPVCDAMGGTYAGNNSCKLSSPASPADALQDWRYLLNERPPGSVKDGLKQRFPDNGDPGYHCIEDAYGPCNMDFYAVAIPKLPTLPGVGQLTPELLVGNVRRNLARFLDPNIAIYEGSSMDDDNTWNSDAPLGSVMRFHMEAGIGMKDAAGVVCTEYAKGDQTGCPAHSRDLKHWIFSTMPLPKTLSWNSMSGGDHPVAGNRQFGVAQLRAGQSLPDIYQKAGIVIDSSGGDALYFYTRGVDRVSNLFHYVAGMGGSIVFAGGHTCWISLQQRVASYVTSNGGVALPAATSPSDGTGTACTDWGGCGPIPTDERGAHEAHHVAPGGMGQLALRNGGAGARAGRRRPGDPRHRRHAARRRGTDDDHDAAAVGTAVRDRVGRVDRAALSRVVAVR